MAVAYSEFTTTGANLLADLRTAILASSDWTRLNAAGRPDTYSCTTTRGAQMNFDLNDVAPNTQVMTIGVYSSYDGTTLGSKVQRWLYYKRVASGTFATNVYRCWVSVGKEHVFIAIEGPRPGDTGGGQDTANGSYRNYFFMNDLVPYFDASIDPNPTIVVGGQQNNTIDATGTNLSHKVWVPKNIHNVAWSSGNLNTLDWPRVGSASFYNPQRVSPDGNYYMAPYVLFDDQDGIRGRLASFFFAGLTANQDIVNRLSAPVNDVVTYAGQKYKLLAVNRTDGNNSNDAWGAFGEASNRSNLLYSVVVGVPTP